MALGFYVDQEGMAAVRSSTVFVFYPQMGGQTSELDINETKVDSQ